ncbi:MAG TPA: hypothetical protein VF666_12700 [Pyrinomonadaceae bacterium]|jgi:hypothetical protein
MSKRLSVRDVFALGASLFADQSPSQLNPELLAMARAGTVSSVEPFVDNESTRNLLSIEQANCLMERGVLRLDQPPSLKRADNILIYLKDYVDRRAYIDEGSEDEHLDSGALEEPERIHLLVLLVFRDTGEVLPHWSGK